MVDFIHVLLAHSNFIVVCPFCIRSILAISMVKCSSISSSDIPPPLLIFRKIGRRILEAVEDEDDADWGDVGDPRKDLIGLEPLIADIWIVNLSGESLSIDLRTFPF